MTGRRRAVFLDRDGVINRSLVIDGKPFAPGTVEEFEILPGVPEAVARLKDAGLAVIVVTNQPDVTRGKHRRADVDAIHKHLKEQVKVDAVYACFCLEGPDCDCYKPKPGMLFEAARDWDIDLKRSFMVGDRWRDIGAGKAAGCRTFFIDYGYRERQPDDPDHVVRDLTGAVATILDRIARD